MQKKNGLIFVVFIPVFIFLSIFVFLEYKNLTSKVSTNSNGNENNTILNNNAVGTENSIPEDASIAFAKAFLVSDKSISKINTSKKIIVFTFDGEANPTSLDSVLKTLEKYNVKAVFFLSGKFADWYPKAVKNIAQSGNEIYSHSYSHPYLTSLTDSQIKGELTRTEDVISTITGKTTKPFYRPPYGASNNHIRQLAATLGYEEVKWTIDALDLQESSGMTASAVKKRIYDNLTPGCIYLMHLSDNITGQVLDDVLKYITDEGYTIVTLRTALTDYQNK